MYWAIRNVVKQNNNPKTMVIIPLFVKMRLLVSSYFDDINAPKSEKMNHGNNGYVPSKKRLENIVEILSDETLSLHCPLP